MLGASSRDIAQKVTVQVAARTIPVGWAPPGAKPAGNR
jgi:hypothetical protein